MNRVFKDCLDTFVIVLIDDIIVYSKIDLEHQEHLWKVLATRRENTLYAKFSKCEFWLRQVSFLEHVVSKDEVFIDPTKVEAITKWERPTTVTSVQSFLGLARYYWRFVQDFARIALLLIQLMRKGVPFIWNDACEASFQNLKRDWTAPVLKVPERSEGYVIYSDASKKRLGCVLMQHGTLILKPLPRGA